MKESPVTSTPRDSAEPSGDFFAKARELVNQMTLEEKALLLSGDGWWATHRIERLGVPSISSYRRAAWRAKGPGCRAFGKRSRDLFSHRLCARLLVGH